MTTITCTSLDDLEAQGYITIDETSTRLGLSPRQVARYIADGKLKHHQVKPWKGKPFPVVYKEDIEILSSIIKLKKLSNYGLLAGVTKNITKEVWVEFSRRRSYLQKHRDCLPAHQ